MSAVQRKAGSSSSAGAGASSASPASSTANTRQITKVVDSSAQPPAQFSYEAANRNILIRWMIDPKLSLSMIIGVLVAQFVWGLVGPKDLEFGNLELGSNPFNYLTRLSHRVPEATVALLEPEAALPGSGDHLVRYRKGYGDLAFVAFYVVVYSFIRQSTTIYLFRPFARWWGITNDAKVLRLTEQGYSLLYWGSSSVVGLYVMSFQESWWYKYEHFWLKYPHWLLRPELKAYYLLQAAYWTQQALVMLLRLEKPRKDYYELVAHHLVTLWLIFWSYLINLTMIGTTVFVAMDVPDSFICTSKILNYLGLDLAATIVFACLMVVWTYFRIYLSSQTLWSVWFEFDRIPEWARAWNPPQGHWLVWWMKYHIFAPLFLLLLLNIFWWALLWRILVRALQGVVGDEREEGEYELNDHTKEGAAGKKQKSQ
ncbi:sphingosine N-acyltransferase lag1 [Tilletia horrida]|uniref:Sphingosine N-acyltransferase lag1 n=1 Tax=Tilletia horrida TaxID=155126 RepID=A0AAN6GAL9_9BASI|nr:sphingosine N-acyltransferase lag1 [Tilletia horrida]